jgi:hypothetical protein
VRIRMEVDTDYTTERDLPVEVFARLAPGDCHLDSRALSPGRSRGRTILFAMG